MSTTQQITIEDNGRVVAAADVHSNPYVVQANLRGAAGAVPSGVRSRLVDAVVDLPGVPPGTSLEMTLPAGDTKMLDRVRQRCSQVDIRAAGASCRLRTTTPAH